MISISLATLAMQFAEMPRNTAKMKAREASARFLTIRDGPISIRNARYYRYQGLEEKYRILAGNIDCFDTAEPAIFLIVASRLMIKMTVLFLNLCMYYFYYYLSRRYKILNILRN